MDKSTEREHLLTKYSLYSRGALGIRSSRKIIYGYSAEDESYVTLHLFWSVMQPVRIRALRLTQYGEGFQWSGNDRHEEQKQSNGTECQRRRDPGFVRPDSV